jgi:hypothetical protein
LGAVLRQAPTLAGWCRVALVWLAACAAPAPLGERAPEPARLEAARIARDVAWLADDAREGRGLGTQGLDAAAQYLAQGFHEAGLRPGGSDGSFYQSLEVPVGIAVVDADLSLNGAPLRRGRDFDGLLVSRVGEVEAGVAFAGYGITAPELGWDDYEGIDVAGRVVLVLDHRPEGDASAFRGGKGTSYLARSYKILNARLHGAAAVLIAPSAADIPGLAARAGDEDATPTTQATSILAVGLSREAAERLVASGGGDTLGDRLATIEKTGRPASSPLRGVRLRASVAVERRRGRIANVVAIRPGSDPSLRDEAVVIGAHYDHLGRGEFGSLAPDRRGEIHNGADDNASGAAGLLELARVLGAGPPTKRSIVLTAFSGEEAGLLGSSEYVASPPIPIRDTVAMINLDMIGRLRDGRISVLGSETSPGFAELVTEAARGLPLSIELLPGGFGPSDHSSFSAAKVPVLFFFSGTHGEYHTPDDDAPLLNVEGVVQVLEVVRRAASALADAPEHPVWVEAQIPAPSPGGGGGYGTYLGTIPAFGGPPVRGVRLQGVRGGSPAEMAGLAAGDVIVEFDGVEVGNLEDFAALLFAATPGRRVEIAYLRGEVRRRTVAILGQRR